MPWGRLLDGLSLATILKIRNMKQILIIICVFFTSNYCRSQVFEQDSLALVALYNSTNGNNWVKSNNWLEEYSMVEYWEGIVVENKRVVGINLGFNNLAGNLPDEIGNLDSLSVLDLSGASILNLPYTIGNLATLDTLDLSYSTIDSLPDAIGNLHDLKLFDFSFTPVRYLPETFVNLTKLEYLYGEDANLQSLPESIGNLLSLKILQLALNEISNLPHSIGNCAQLISLTINANQIPEIPTEIGNLSNLETLILGGNNISVLPEELFMLTKLKTLNFAANNLNQIPSSIGNLTNLENFQFFKNNFTSIPSEIGNLVNLTYINGYSNNLDNLPSTLLNLPNLQTLFLAYNSLTFEDIEPLITLTGFEYWLQDSICSQIDTTLALNASFRMECLTGGTFNKYQWLKDGDTIPGATNYFLELPVVTFADSGEYFCEVTNSIATGLTLFRRPIKLKIEVTSNTNETLLENADQIMIYPNPARGNVSIKAFGIGNLNEIEILILNTDGAVLSEYEFNNNTDLDLDISNFSSGTYYVHFSDKNGEIKRYFKKLIVLK